MMKRAAAAAALTLLVGASGTEAQGAVSGRILRAGLGLSEAVLTLVPVGESVAPEGPLARQLVDQIHLTFVPGVLVVTPGTEVSFLNSDPLLHNVFSPSTVGGAPLDLGTYPRGQAQTTRFDAEGVHTLLCHIHPEMVAYVLVTSARHRAVTSADGQFTLDDVPQGRYDVQVWHPRLNDGPRVFPLTVGSEPTVDLRFEVLR